MAEMIEYKCPNCGGALSFDSGVQKMKCPFCDTELDTDALRELDEELKNDRPDDLNWGEASGSEWQSGEQDGLSHYVCSSCGGEIVTEQTTAATSCPFCDSPVVLTDRLSGSLRPDLVIPFKLDKNAAIAGMKKHLSGKRLLPKVFKDEHHLEEVKGLYVPFWLFDAQADANMRYRATRVRSWSTSSYIYTETSHYSVRRAGTLDFKNVPVDGSEKMPDDLMDSIEPFDYREAVDFQTAFLAGYLADKYDVSAEESKLRAGGRIKNSTESMFLSTVHGYNSVRTEHSGVQLQKGAVKYALLPIWMLKTEWNGKIYTFAMNGQTGKFVGNLPMDKGAWCKWFFGLLGGVGAASFGLMSLLRFL